MSLQCDNLSGELQDKWSSSLKVAMLKLLFEFDVVTFAQEIMSVQGQLTLLTYDVRLTFESGVISTSYQYVH